MLHGAARRVRVLLDERQWSKVAAILNAERGAGRPAKDDRNFIEAVLWWAPSARFSTIDVAARVN